MKSSNLHRWAGVRAALLAVALLASLGPLATRASADVGHRDFSFGNVHAPTAEKPQSKLWFADGSWWGSLFRTATDNHEIFRFNATTDEWNATGTVIDERNNVLVDALWDGSHLYVASAGRSSTNSAQSVRIGRYGYNPATGRYSRDSGYPVTVVNGGMEAVVLEKDSIGRLWITYTRDSRVYVSHTTTDDRSWTVPFVLPVSGAGDLTDDDISAIVSFESKIGVMWSNQNEQILYFATHEDGAGDDAWTVTHALEGAEWIDDHINLKALEGDPAGRVFAATKTSLDPAGAPEILLLVLEQDGTWSRYPFGTVADTFTRPIVLLDEANRQIHMLAAQGPCCNGGTIYRKQTSLDDPSFTPGHGTAFIQSGADAQVNNPTSTKQNLNGTTELLVLAGDDTTSDFYLHDFLSLGDADSTPPDTTIDSGPADVVTEPVAAFDFSSSEPGATFECSLDGDPFLACSAPQNYAGLAVGTHTFQVRATDAAGNLDPTPASRSWTVAAGSTPLFNDGFESGDFSGWTSVVTGGDGNATIQSAIVRSGSYAARLSASATSGSVAYARKSLTSGRSSVSVLGDFRILAAGAGGSSGNVPLVRLYDPAGARLVNIYRQNGSGNGIFVSHSGSSHATGGLLPLERWSRLGVRVVTGGAGASTVEVDLDGARIYTTTSASLGSSGVLTLQVGNDTKQQQFSLIADNISAEL